jgi:hypothetical protein
MAQYDPAVLQEHVDFLYRRARWIRFQYAAMGALIGVIPTIVLASISKVADAFPVIPVGILLAGLCAFIGFAIGSSKIFKYRLEAQTMLCQMQIERNTRKEDPSKSIGV